MSITPLAFSPSSLQTRPSVFSLSVTWLKSISEELERSPSLDEEISAELEDRLLELEEDDVALDDASSACELEDAAVPLEEEFCVWEEELLSEEVSFAEDDSAVDDVSAELDKYSISVLELSDSNCSAPVAELSLSPQDASNKAKKM